MDVDIGQRDDAVIDATQAPNCSTCQAPPWSSGFTAWLPERVSPVRRVGYTLRDLARRGLLDAEAVEAFCQETYLADFAWRLLWADADPRPDGESLAYALAQAEGVVVFVHGWDGNGDIWEDMPAQVLKKNPRLIALVPDVNGFGGTPFVTHTPPLDRCGPPAVMASLERWIDLLDLRGVLADGRLRPFTFVGHSMGGAALFFLDDSHWQPHEVGRIAAAPALLLNDRQRRRFYKTLSTGIHLSRLNDFIDRLAENVIAPRMIEALASGGSERVRAEHHRIYRVTPEGVVARTFAALGRLEAHFDQDEWPHFVVFLAHRDRLVGLQNTLELLESIHFHPAQIRLVLGDHYFFSVGCQASLHAQNRAMLIAEIMAMHRALRRWRRPQRRR